MMINGTTWLKPWPYRFPTIFSFSSDRRMELNSQPLPLRPNQKKWPVFKAVQQFKTLS